MHANRKVVYPHITPKDVCVTFFIHSCCHNVNKGITWLFSGILFICARVVSFAARAANDTTRAQINNIPEKSHVIIIIINKQGQMISRVRFLIIQAKWITNYIQSHFKSSCKCWLNKLLKNQLGPVNLLKITEKKCLKSSINNRRITKLTCL